MSCICRVSSVKLSTTWVSSPPPSDSSACFSFGSPSTSRWENWTTLPSWSSIDATDCLELTTTLRTYSMTLPQETKMDIKYISSFLWKTLDFIYFIMNIINIGINILVLWSYSVLLGLSSITCILESLQQCSEDYIKYWDQNNDKSQARQAP